MRPKIEKGAVFTPRLCCIIGTVTRKVKCRRLFRPQFRKFTLSFFAQIRKPVLDTPMPNVDVSDDTRVR